jgi:hypothetical protein
MAEGRVGAGGLRRGFSADLRGMRRVYRLRRVYRSVIDGVDRAARPNGRESTVDGNVLVPAAAPRRIKLLHELPSPSSDWTARQPHARWVARVTKRLAPTGAGKSASGVGA